MGRGLLFQRQLPWRGRLSHPRSKPRTTYAVLAILSDSYPPLKGRLPTCYSPVRHFTQDRSPFLVRLACVRPAANVRSEPGSNSPVFLKSDLIAQSFYCFELGTRILRLFSSRFSFQRPTCYHLLSRPGILLSLGRLSTAFRETAGQSTRRGRRRYSLGGGTQGKTTRPPCESHVSRQAAGAGAPPSVMWP